MKVYTYSQARQKLAKLLMIPPPGRKGSNQTARRQTFVIKQVQMNEPSSDVAGVTTDISLDELNQAVRESRERF